MSRCRLERQMRSGSEKRVVRKLEVEGEKARVEWYEK